MTKKAIKIIPLILVICLIIDAINLFVPDTPKFMSYLAIFSTVGGLFATSLLVFIWDIIRNNSDLAKFGLVLIIVYAVLSFVLNLVFKKALTDGGSIDLYSILSKIQSTVLVLINGLNYYCITRLLSKKSNDSLIQKVQVISTIAILAYCGSKLIRVWGSFDMDSFMYKLPSLLDSIMIYSIVSFAILQLVDDTPTLEEVAAKPQLATGTVTNGITAPNAFQQNTNGGMSTTPRFRNPALEQQEAMFAQQQAQQQQIQQQAYMQQPQQTQYQDPNAMAGYNQQTYQQYPQSQVQNQNVMGNQQFNQQVYQQPNQTGMQ